MEVTRLLLVDDEPNIIKSMRRALRGEGYQFLTANSANEALDILSSEEVDVVISDHRMPGMTGAELFAQVQQRKASPVGIMISGQADMDAVIDAVNDGNIYKFLHKPWKNETLREVVDSAVKVAQARAALEKRADIQNHLDYCSELETLDGDYSIVLFELRNANAMRGDSNHLNRREEFLSKLDTYSKEVIGESLLKIREIEGNIFAAIYASTNAGALETFLQKSSGRCASDDGFFVPSMSIGFAHHAHKHTTDRAAAFRYALQALTATTEIGVATEHTEQISRNLHLRQSLEEDMRSALDNGAFFLQLQPQLASITREVVGAEALCRWTHPAHGTISPQIFIDLAEQNGFINQLGQWVIEQGCRTLLELGETHLLQTRLSINVSPRQFGLRGWVDHVLAFVDQRPDLANLLELEITESSMMQDPKQAMALLNELRSTGVRIAMDDFGTGHSSLSHINQLPIDVLKLDRSLITGIEQEVKSRRLLQNLIRMGKDLELEIIAEGVETQGQLMLCEDLGCDIIQGFIFHKPLSLEEYVRLQ